MDQCDAGFAVDPVAIVVRPAVRERPLPPVAGPDRERFVRQAQLDFQDFAIVGDARIKAVSFTGSTAVGKAIQLQAARHLTPTQLELGGKNPAIVLADADLDQAVAEIVRAAFTVAGQWCTSTSRVSPAQP